MTQSQPKAPEFSYEIDLDGLGPQGKQYRLAANEEERRKIALRLETPAVGSLEGEVRASATKTLVRVEGSFKASLVRECVASLEPMDEEVSETFEIDFSRVAPATEEELLDLDAPETIEGDRLDLGELLVQQLSLAMDPFPRKPGAQSLAEAYAPPETVSPFAVLKGAVGKSDDNQ